MKFLTGFLCVALILNGITASSPIDDDDVDDCETGPKCPRGEDFRTDLSCIESCDDTLCARVRQLPQERCFCKSSSMARVNGKCVPRRECGDSRVCGFNSAMRLGTKCEEKCKADLDDVCDSRKQYMDCFCNDGYRRFNGQCIPAEECPCGENRQYKTCASPCDSQCPGSVCAAVCVEGCVCQKSLAEVKGECLPKDLVCKKPIG